MISLRNLKKCFLTDLLKAKNSVLLMHAKPESSDSLHKFVRTNLVVRRLNLFYLTIQCQFVSVKQFTHKSIKIKAPI